MTVFVSYSSRDRDAVKSLTQGLQDADEQVWMDQRLAEGEAWWRAILEQIRAVERIATGPARRLIVTLAAEHAARTGAIRHLVLDDVDLPNRRITIAGHNQRLGDLTHKALTAWLDHRRATWPRTPNRHVLITGKTSVGAGPVSEPFVREWLGNNGFTVDRIRADRILHEALTAGPDPLHLSLVFNIAHETASRYVMLAEQHLADQLEQPPGQ